MKIKIEEVRHIAGLSRLRMSEDEIDIMGSQLNSILGYIEQLNRLDTGNITPTSHVIPLNNVMREDMPAISLPRTEALKNAPDSTEEFYRVLKIIE